MKLTDASPDLVNAVKHILESKIEINEGFTKSHIETPAHRISTDKMGHVELTHKDSGKSVYLQGDDARDFHKDFDQLKKKKVSLDMVDHHLSQYHHVMEETELSEGWKYHQYPDQKSARDAWKAHHAWRDDKGMSSGNPARVLANGKVAYQGDFKGPKPRKTVDEEALVVEGDAKQSFANLGVYMRKRAKAAADAGNHDDAAKKNKTAEHWEKLAKEEIEITEDDIEVLNEISAKLAHNYEKKASQSIVNLAMHQKQSPARDKKIVNRAAGREKAEKIIAKDIAKRKAEQGKKLAKEDTDMADKDIEQLDELSIDKLKDYTKKSKDSEGKLKDKLNNKFNKADFKKFTNRKRGQEAAIRSAGKKALASEEVEQIDELAPKTLKSYVKKSTKASERAWNKHDKEEDNAMSTDGTKYPDKQNRHIEKAKGHAKEGQKRDAGIAMAKKKLKEETSLISKIINKYSNK